MGQKAKDLKGKKRKRIIISSLRPFDSRIEPRRRAYYLTSLTLEPWSSNKLLSWAGATAMAGRDEGWKRQGGGREEMIIFVQLTDAGMG